jgi:hypothetical protein
MITKKEWGWLIIVSLIFGFIINLSINSAGNIKLNNPTRALIIAFIIIFISVICKKIAARYFYVKIEHQIWGFQRFWYAERNYFKKPAPIGLILPFFLSILSLGYIKCFTLLQFNAENSKTRILKQRGLHRHSEINESDLAFVSAWGFWGLIILAIIGVIVHQPELTKYTIFYGIWNLLPLGQLDGTKLFFGSLFNWMLLAVVYIIACVIVLI